MKKQTTYCLRVKGTEELVRINDTRWVVGEYTDTYPLYEQDSPLKVQQALARNTKYYNASYDAPSHGELSAADLEIVERVVTEEHLPMLFELCPVLDNRHVARKPAGTLRRYAGLEAAETLPVGIDHLCILALPSGETVESMRRFEGVVVPLGDIYCAQLFRVFEVPEDYLGDLSGKPGFAAATSALT